MPDEFDSVIIKNKLLDLGIEVGENNIKVDQYHKEKNRCLEICQKQGERLGEVEKEIAVQKNEVINMKETVHKIEKAITGLQIKVAMICGGVMGIFKLLEYLK